MIYMTTHLSPVGRLTLASSGESLNGLWIEGQKYFGQSVGEMTNRDDIPIFHRTKRWLNRYFAGEKPDICELPLEPIGSAFRQMIWRFLCEIPYGRVTTYGEIAKKAAEQLHREHMSGQAVGGAVGHNPISIIIPCHRVVGANGSLTGYAAGVDVKIKLLEIEGTDTSCLFVPKKGTAL